MAERRGISLRLRLIVGAMAIASVAVFAAGLAAWGTIATARLIERSETARQRIDLLSNLSAQISNYAVMAVETTNPSVPRDARHARLASQEAQVEDAFARIDRALDAAVAESEPDGEAEQMRRATRSLGVARMRAQFRTLGPSVDQAETASALRAHLDGFATRFSPLIDEAIIEEQRDHNAARAEVARLRGRMIQAALGAGLGAMVLTGVFHLTLVRPLMTQLTHIRDAAARIGEGKLSMRPPFTRSRELNWVFRELGRTAGRLKDREAQVNADRAQLSQTIAARTSELEQANARLSQVDSDRRRFFADIGHELRTPLTVILAESELGLQGPMDPGDARDSFSVIHARAQRLNRRIDDLLRVAHSETGEIPLNIGAFDLAEAAADAIQDVGPLAKNRNIRLTTNLNSAPATGDADWCRQVIGGLIENALKHSTKGCAVEVCTGVEAENAVLSITDDGPGLPPGEAEMVFTRFARGSREAANPGFGVGLTLARWVIEQQSGVIALESPATHAPEAGTGAGPGVTVRLSLPSGPAS